MVDLDEFVNGISVHLGNSDSSKVPQIAIEFAARQTVKRFCDDSLSYIVSAFDASKIDHNRQPLLSDIEMTQSGGRCELTLPANTHIIKVWRVQGYHDWCDAAGRNYVYDYPNVVRLDRGEAEHMTVALSLNQDATECPDYIYHQYYDGILSGMIAYLQAMPNREWAMPNFAENHEMKFQQAVLHAKQAVAKGFRKRQASTSIPPSFG